MEDSRLFRSSPSSCHQCVAYSRSEPTSFNGLSGKSFVTMDSTDITTSVKQANSLSIWQSSAECRETIPVLQKFSGCTAVFFTPMGTSTLGCIIYGSRGMGTAILPAQEQTLKQLRAPTLTGTRIPRIPTRCSQMIRTILCTGFQSSKSVASRV